MIAGNNGDHTEKLRPNDTARNPSDELVEKTEALLADTYAEASESSNESEASNDKVDPNPDKDGLEAEVPSREDPIPDKAKDGDDGVKKDDDKDKDAAGEGDNVLPDAYEQAALRNGWTQDEIDEAVAQNPERAKKMFGNLHQSMNQASRDFAALGRAKQIAAEQAAAAQSQPAPQVDDGQKTRDINISKLREEFPDNPLVDVLDAVIQEVRASKAVQAPQIDAQATQRANAAEDYAVQQRVDNFFSSDQMNPYSEFYGKVEIGQDWDDLSSGQRANRWRVLKEADAIVMGYAAIRQTIEPEEALSRAHMLVSDGIKEKIIRDRIKATATKRSNSITMQPSKGKRTEQSADKFDAGDKKPRDRKELEVQVSQKMAKVFGQQR